MPASSCAERVGTAPKQYEWFTAMVDWPVESLVAELEVTAPRELNPLEWVLEQILDTFQNEIPTLAEAARELGIHDPVPLQDVLRGLLELRAVEVKLAGVPIDLTHCQLTDRGRELLREGRVSDVIERHGLMLHLDALTGELHKGPSRSLSKTPARPIVRPEALPPRMTEIGLDRVRQLSLELGEPFHQGESRIVGARVRVEEGQHSWVQRQAALSISTKGLLCGAMRGATPGQQAWFEGHGVGITIDLARSAAPSWANGRWKPTGASFDQWRLTVERLVPPEKIANQALELVDAAGEEVVLHHGWLDAPRLADGLTRAARRGVRCCTCGEAAALSHWTARPNGPPGFMAAFPPVGDDIPCSIVVDRTRALSANRLCTQGPGGADIEVQVVIAVKPDAVSHLMDQLLASIDTGSIDNTREELFAAFALTGAMHLWEEGAQRIWNETGGVERASAQRDWARWGQVVAHQVIPDGGWMAWALRGWHAALQGGAEPDALLDAATDVIDPPEAVEAICRRIEPASAGDDPDPICDLLDLANLAVGHWPEFDPVGGCAALSRRIAACLTFEDEQVTDTTVEIIGALAQTKRFQAHAPAWSVILSSCLPKPQGAADLIAWLAAHLPLQRHVGSALRRDAKQHLNRLRANIASPSGRLLHYELRRAWQAIGLPAEALARCLEGSSKKYPAAEVRRQGT